jgi:HEAT repeat protein
VEVKKSILNAFAIAGATDRLVAAALQETDYDELVEAAIHGLGVAGGTIELRKLYKEVQSQEAKADIVQAAGIIADDEEFLAEIVRTEKDPDLRRKAIHAMGVSGGRDVAPTLVGIYDGTTDRQTRQAVVEALFISDNAAALVSLARKESDPQMKREIVQKLSLMDDPEATDYMMQILEQ